MPWVLKTDAVPQADQLVELYQSVGWTTYATDPKSLIEAVRQSTFVVTAWEGNKLVGLVRIISDDVSIAYFQDILVHPNAQRQGIGRAAVQKGLTRFEHVRQRVLLTDNDDGQRLFYEALGFQNTATLKRTPLNAYVLFRGVELD